MSRETRLTGICVVPGQGMGIAFFVGRDVQETSAVSITRQAVGDQIMRFNEIREKAKADYRNYAQEGGGSSVIDTSILQTYELILDDPAFVGQVVEAISTKLYDVETAIRLVSNEFIKRFNAAGNAYLRERAGDMVEICEKLVSHLHTDEGRAKTFAQPVVLVVLRTFTPTDILSYDRSRIQAIVSASGGKTSHAAILARSYSIPVISGVRNITQSIRPGDELLVNADKGTVYVRPGAVAVGKLQKSRGPSELVEALKKKWQRPVYTQDGVKIEVMANVSLAEDVNDALECGADGIGLVRTEYLLSNRRSMPDEQVQREFYESILKRTGSRKHCVIRVFDIGGDKVPGFFDMPTEFNPFMGWRAIRILLDRRDIFETQLTAIMKAGQKQNYSIMVPMVTTLQEWLEAKAFVKEVAQKVGVPVPPCGVLFEVPLAVLEMGSFMKELDFASIGTNDLTQYLSAADRNNAKVNYLYNPIEPAFLRIIKNAIDVSNANGKPVSICGEMAGNPAYSIMLVGLGLRRFSVMPRNIPIIKELISRVSYAATAEAVSHIEAIESTEAAGTWLRSINKRLLGDALEQLGVTEEA
jgi:phosphotransferase system enzyme I (PtsI)